MYTAELIGVEDRATQGEGAAETQEARHPRLHQTPGLRGLDLCAEISIRLGKLEGGAAAIR